MWSSRLLRLIIIYGCAASLFLRGCCGWQCPAHLPGILSGNITLGFLFSYHGSNASTQECEDHVPNLENIQLIEAATMILLRNTGIPGLSFGLESWDTCSSKRFAVKSTAAYLSVGGRVSDASLCLPSVVKPGIVAGLKYAGQGEAISRMLNDAEFPLISFAATQSALTTNNTYPFFMRTVPNDDFEAAGLVTLLQRMNWRYVTTVALDTVEDKAARDAFTQAASRGGICISSSHQFPPNLSDDDLGQLISNFTSNPSVKVVVLFASPTGSRKIFTSIQRSATRDMQFVVNHNAALGIAPNITNLRGVFGFRIPLPTQEDDFDDYFKQLTPENVDFGRNPWFADYWQRKYKCNLNWPGTIQLKYEANCSDMHVEMHRRTYKRHPYASRVIDAVLAFTTSLGALYESKCPNGNSLELCDSLRDIDSQQLLSYIKRVNFSTENGNYFTFSPSGDVYHSSLEVVNYRVDVDGGFRFQPVGTYEKGILILDMDGLEFQSSGGITPTQSVCRSPCMDPACGETLPDQNPMVYIPGDVILGGFFAVHKWNASESTCGSLDASGVKRLEAVLYAMDKINDDSSILPGIKLGMDGFDTCSSPGRAGHQVLQLASKGQFGQSGSGQRLNPEGLFEHVYGIVGPAGDEECQLVNGVLQIYGVPMISYAATSTSLSNTFQYKNFARTVFSDSVVGLALLSAISTKNWKYGQILYSNTASGRYFMSVLTQTASRMEVCLTTSQIIPSADNVDEMDEVFITLTSRPMAKVIFISATNSDMRNILSEFRRRNLYGQYYLILANQWSTETLQEEFSDIAPGVLYLREKRRSYPDFKSYFSRLNPSDNQRNPWFPQYWSDTFRCNLPGSLSQYAQNCTGFESLSPDDGEDMRIAQTVDAVYAMARALSALHAKYCPGETTVCPEMTTATGDELFQSLTARANYFPSINDGYPVQITSWGDVTPDFEIVNTQILPNGTLKNQTVGVYRNYFYQALDDVTVYSKESGSYVEISNAVAVCEGPCDDCKRLEKIEVAEVAGGDVWIGGMFKLHEPSSDGLECKTQLITHNVQLVEAFLYAVDLVNQDATILPELKLGAIAFDTCGSEDRAQREALNFVSGTVDYRSGYFQIQPSVVGIVGGQISDTTTTVAEALTPLGVNQISYAATTNELSDANKFPYFLRTVPSDDKQASAIVNLIQTMDWRYISVVYSDNAYGTDLRKSIMEKIAGTSICVAMSLKLSASFDDRDFERVTHLLQQNPHAKVVLLLTSDIHTKHVLEAAERISLVDLQWIGTDTWGNRDYIIENAQITSRGALALSFQEPLRLQAFKDYFTNLPLYNNRRNPWWQTYAEDTFKCNVFGSRRSIYNVTCQFLLHFESIYKQEPEVLYILDAVQLFANGLHEAMVNQCPGVTRYICADLAAHPEILHHYIREANVTRNDGSVFTLDKNGDGQPFYDIFSVQASGNANIYMKIGNWTPDGLNLGVRPPPIQSICSGRCAECSLIKQSSFVHLPGSLQIVGLFDAHGSGNYQRECGELRDAGIINLEAMLFAVDIINADPTILEGVTLGATAFDTCARGSRAVRDLSSVFTGAFTPEEDNTQRVWSIIAGVIGGENEDITSSITSLTKRFQYTQLNYGENAVDVNQDHLLRTGPSIDGQVLAVIKLLQQFNWQYVAVVSSASTYRIQQTSAFSRAAENHICISMQEEITQQSSIAGVLQRLYEAVDQNIVILFTDEMDTLQIVEAVSARVAERHLTWVIAFNENMEKQMFDDAILGAFLVNSVPAVVPDFEAYFTSLKASSNQRDPWFGEFISRIYECNWDGIGNFSEACTGLEVVPEHILLGNSALVGNVINAVYAVAHGVQDLIEDRCGGGPGLCSEFVGLRPEELQQGIQDTSFTSPSGNVVNFRNGTTGHQFAIWNLKERTEGNTFVKIGNWTLGNVSVETSQVSFYGVDGQPSTVPVPSHCQTSMCRQICSLRVPTTVPLQTTISLPTTPPNANTSVLRMHSPTTMPLPSTAHADVSTTLQPTTSTVSYLSSRWFIILLIIGIIGIIVASAMVVLIIIKWKLANNKPKCLSPFLGLVLLVGVILMYLIIPVNAAPQSMLVCTLQRLWPGLAFGFCQVAMFLVAVRMNYMSRHVYAVSGSTPDFLGTFGQVSLFAILMALEVVILVEWLILQPPEIVASNTEDEVPTATCARDSSNLAAFTYVYVLPISALFTALPAVRKSAISAMEIGSLLLIIVGSLILLIVWALIVALGPLTYYLPGMTIIATIKATLILVLLTSYLYKILVFKHDNSADLTNLKLDDYGSEEPGIISPFPDYPDSRKEDDDVAITPGIKKVTTELDEET